MVVGNIFAQYDSRGIPLDIVFEVTFRQNAVPCWVTFYEDARRCGWKDKKILTTIEQSLRDIARDPSEVIRMLEAYIQHQNS